MGSVAKLVAYLQTSVPEEYILTPAAKFLDIGHGLGPVVFGVAVLAKCKSAGIEYDPLRYQKSVEAKSSFLHKYGGRQWLNLVSFYEGDVTEFQQLDSFDYLYSYNIVWPDKAMSSLCEILNKVPFKVLVWSKSKEQSMKYGLKGIEQIGSVVCRNSGKQSHTFYVFGKINARERKNNGESN